MTTLEKTCQQYRAMRFSATANDLPELLAKAEEAQFSYLHFATLLAENEQQKRTERRIALNRSKAGIPVCKRLEDFDYSHQTSISKRQVNQLLDFSFVDNRENIVFIGTPGVGKTHLAIGIGEAALDQGYKVSFTTALSLVELLEVAELKGELKQKINQILKFDLLIIDELGYLPMNKQGMYNLFQLINAMYEYRSLIVTTNKDFTYWGEFFIDDNVAVPVVDRIIHHSHVFMLGGESYRLRTKLDH